MIQALQAILSLFQGIAGGGEVSAEQAKAGFQAVLAVIHGYLLSLQPVAGQPGVVAVPEAFGAAVPPDPNDPHSSRRVTLRTVPVPYATVAARVKELAAQTQNEQWAAGFTTAASLLSMLGGGA